jgi:hypothetical protein
MGKSEKERKEIAERYEKTEKERVKINEKYIKLSQRLKEPVHTISIQNNPSNSNTL